MNPNGESVNQEGANSADKPNPATSGAEGAVNPLGDLEKAVKDAALQSTQNAGIPSLPQDPTPQEQFTSQFGSEITASATENSESVLSDIKLSSEPSIEAPKNTSSVPPDSGINNINDLLKNASVGDSDAPIVEAAPKPEKTPADKLKQKISEDIDAFLAEVTVKEKITA